MQDSRIMNPETREPRRIQQRRTRGWTMPPNTISVARPPRFGNPYQVVKQHHTWGVKPPGYANIEPTTRSHTKEEAQAHAVAFYAVWAESHIDDIKQLAGKNLACFCPPHTPCHADVLLQIANTP